MARKPKEDTTVAPELIWYPTRNAWIVRWLEDGKPMEKAFNAGSLVARKEAEAFMDTLVRSSVRTA